MPHFNPPAHIATENRVRSGSSIKLEGTIAQLVELAMSKYNDARREAMVKDDANKSFKNFRTNAVDAAVFTMLAAARASKV